jgi:hypothetical protein
MGMPKPKKTTDIISRSPDLKTVQGSIQNALSLVIDRIGPNAPAQPEAGSGCHTRSYTSADCHLLDCDHLRLSLSAQMATTCWREIVCFF